MSVRLAPEVNRILFVKNLPEKITGDELYEIFGKFGAIRQIRKYGVVVTKWSYDRGNAADTKFTAFVVYEDLMDAKNAVEHLTGFNVGGRYLSVLYYQPNKVTKKMDLEKKRAELEALKARYKVDANAQETKRK